MADDDWIAHALDELLPMMESSSVVASIVPTTGVDAKFALELGFAMMLDKPIIIVIRPGMAVPAKLMKVADAVVEGDITTDQGRRSLSARLETATARLCGDE